MATNTKNRFAGKADTQKPIGARHLTFSFKDLCVDQGKTFIEWEASGFLSQACETLKSYSAQLMGECFSKRFKIYDGWPGHSNLKRPKNVPEDAMWASMHIQGKECFGGHIVGDVFYIVFLDDGHDLWPTKKKGT